MKKVFGVGFMVAVLGLLSSYDTGIIIFLQAK